MKTNWGTFMRIGLVVVLAGLFGLGAVRPAQAADVRTGNTVIIAADEVINDDLIVSGEHIEVNGTVNGDVIAAGSEIVINGTVDGNVIFTGQLLTLNGVVEGSVYGGGYSLVLGPEASISRNLYFGGFSLETDPDSTLDRNLYMGGYQALLGGAINRNVLAGLAALELNGNVGGDVRVEVAEPDPDFNSSSQYWRNTMPASVEMVPPGLRVGDGAQVEGSFTYISPIEQPMPAAVVAGDVVFATPVPSEPPAAAPTPAPVPAPVFGLGQWFDGFSRRAGEFIALLIVGALLLRFWPENVKRVSAKAQERPLPSFGQGGLVTLAFFFGVPLAAIAIVGLALLGGLVTYGQLFSTILGVGGAALGLTVTVFLFVLSLVTKVIVGYLVGRLILVRVAPQVLSGRWGELLALASGLLAYEILRAIPFGLGWVIGVLVTLVGLGAIYLVLREGFARRPAPPVVLAVAP